MKKPSKESSDARRAPLQNGQKKPLTLASLEVMPATPQHARGLKDMTLPELEAADRGLRALPERLEKMSGICAVLNGLILSEIKGRCAHKEWTPWLKANYGKTSRNARYCMQIASAFSKTETRFRFEPEQLTLALLDDTQSGALDLTHPVVMSVEKWADGRSFRKLIEECGKASGGKTYEREGGKGARQRLTHAQAMEVLRTVNVNAMQHLRFLHDKHAYVAVKDEAELDGLLNHLEETTKAVRAWKKMSQTERAAVLAEQVKSQINAAKE